MVEQESGPEQAKSADWFVEELNAIAAGGTDINEQRKQNVVAAIHKPIQEGIFSDEDKVRLVEAMKLAEPNLSEQLRQQVEDSRHYLEHPESGNLP